MAFDRRTWVDYEDDLDAENVNDLEARILAGVEGASAVINVEDPPFNADASADPAFNQAAIQAAVDALPEVPTLRLLFPNRYEVSGGPTSGGNHCPVVIKRSGVEFVGVGGGGIYTNNATDTRLVVISGIQVDDDPYNLNSWPTSQPISPLSGSYTQGQHTLTVDNLHPDLAIGDYVFVRTGSNALVQTSLRQPTSEINQVKDISGSDVTLTLPLGKDYSADYSSGATGNQPCTANATTNIFSTANPIQHGLVTGQPIRFAGTATPTGISSGTTYYVVRIDLYTWQVSDTYAHAVAGTGIIDFTTAGTSVTFGAPPGGARYPYGIARITDNLIFGVKIRNMYLEVLGGTVSAPVHYFNVWGLEVDNCALWIDKFGPGGRYARQVHVHDNELFSKADIALDVADFPAWFAPSTGCTHLRHLRNDCYQTSDQPARVHAHEGVSQAEWAHNRYFQKDGVFGVDSGVFDFVAYGRDLAVHNETLNGVFTDGASSDIVSIDATCQGVRVLNNSFHGTPGGYHIRDLSADGEIRGNKFSTTHPKIITSDVLETGVVANNQTTAYTLALPDAGQLIEVDSSSSRTVTVPTNASVPFAVGTVVVIQRMNTGAVPIAASGGVTLNSVLGLATIAHQYGVVRLRKTATDTWVLDGDLA